MWRALRTCGDVLARGLLGDGFREVQGSWVARALARACCCLCCRRTSFANRLRLVAGCVRCSSSSLRLSQLSFLSWLRSFTALTSVQSRTVIINLSTFKFPINRSKKKREVRVCLFCYVCFFLSPGARLDYSVWLAHTTCIAPSTSDDEKGATPSRCLYGGSFFAGLATLIVECVQW